MASTISIRVYLIQVQQRGNRAKLSFDDTTGGIDVPSFISNLSQIAIPQPRIKTVNEAGISR